MIRSLIEKLQAIIEWIQSRLSLKQFVLFSSVLVGLSVGLAAIVLKTLVHYIYLASTYKELGNYKYLFLCLPALGILFTVLIIKHLLKGKLEKGLSHIHYAIAKKSSFLPKEQMYAQIVTSSLTVGLGGSAGLEAPIVLTGAAFGSNYAKTYKLGYKERTLLLACGIAAGIGATFNAPIAGVLFALEVLLVDISISAFTPLIIAAATGALISKIVLQDDILLSFSLLQPFNYNNVPQYIVLGVMAGLISVYHLRMFEKVEHLFNKKKEKIFINIIWGGLALAGLIFMFPTLFGEGYQSIKYLAELQPENILSNSIFEPFKTNQWVVLTLVGLLIFIKPIATGLTVGSGGNGGNFAPSLFVGAYLGFFFASCVNKMGLGQPLPIINFTIVGMAGILSGLYHAPLTAIFLIAEITGGYTLMIPLMIVSSLSFAFSKYFEPYSMDIKQLALSGKIYTNDKDQNILATISTSNLIETDFQPIYQTDTLATLVEIIAKSKRNVFPVINADEKLVGLVSLDNIREIIFKTEMYQKTTVKDLMIPPPAIINANQSMEAVMQLFDQTGAWNLPVVNNGKYIGFVSKSSIFSSYRSKLKSTTIE